MTKPVCIKCQRFYRMKRGGVTITDRSLTMREEDEILRIIEQVEANSHFWQAANIWGAYFKGKLSMNEREAALRPLRDKLIKERSNA